MWTMTVDKMNNQFASPIQLSNTKQVVVVVVVVQVIHWV